jgi:aldose 1-epimerase
MTCPPDAFNSGKDLIHLQPGDSHTASWTIRALDQPA